MCLQAISGISCCPKSYPVSQKQAICGCALAILGLAVAIGGGMLLMNTNNEAYIALLVAGCIIMAWGMANTNHPGF